MTGGRNKIEDDADKVYKAVRSGHWNVAEEFLKTRPYEVITPKDQTALQVAVAVAVAAGHMHRVEKLMELMKPEELEIRDNDVESADTRSQTCLNISTIGERQSDKVKTEASVPGVWRHLVSQVYNFLGIENIYKAKLIHTQSQELLSRNCEEISKSNPREREDGRFYSAINLAVKNGIFEFVSKILSNDPELLWNKDRKSRNIFSLAVLHRQAKIFSLIFGTDLKNALTSCRDDDDNVFTVPGSNNQATGYPLFLSRKIFILFVISDALSLFSASTSVLMFLGILTSRYTKDDFLESLPRKMIIGLSTLFFSIAAMMITFCAALLIILHGAYSFLILVFGKGRIILRQVHEFHPQSRRNVKYRRVGPSTNLGEKLCAHNRLDRANEARKRGVLVEPKAYMVDPRYLKKKVRVVKSEEAGDLPEKMAKKRRRLKQFRLSFVKKTKRMMRQAF
ncbi:Pentatricopeptide repeat-containing protein PNM1, mitochondrial [Morella rubra]|uniref:Pentatricopeptide repeat-containing protein PNM1, mitochondrial n=1 Tax=Morella rubra TaxID=262757 RepID=A0A6A1VKE6_9ROSI|nr:Pentatricopeptide repeat-containing protein PNM1, mitochondrial [Morella rubra]